LEQVLEMRIEVPFERGGAHYKIVGSVSDVSNHGQLELKRKQVLFVDELEHFLFDSSPTESPQVC